MYKTSQHPSNLLSRNACGMSHRRGARDARHKLKECLESKGLTSAADPAVKAKADAALLIVTELVTNAYRHSTGLRQMRTRWDGPDLTIEIDDDGAATVPVVRPHDERGEDGGFGMALVDQLADGWGVQCRAGRRGKTVYARIRFPLREG